MIKREIRYFCFFGAIGGQAAGFKNSRPRVGRMQGVYRCLGSVDVDPAANRDFRRLIGAPATTMDLFDRSQYIDFHGHEPPPEWREATPQDIQRAAGGERPHVVILSAPCKGFSGLLAQAKSLSKKYIALNRLTLRAVFLMLEAWKDDPPELIAFENVPRIMTRGRELLDQIIALLRAYGYAVNAESVHDCGELGGLAQSRKRFLLVARHMEKVPPFLYEPDKKPLRAVGDVLGKMPLPGDPCAGPMHRIPSLQWKTWVRLAFVEAGSDWRSLNKLAVEDGVLRDYLIVPSSQEGSGAYGVNAWDEHAKLIAARSGPSNGPFSIADPRFGQSEKWHDGHAYGVRAWDQPSATVTSKLAPGSGYGTVADPRHAGPAKHSNEFAIVHWDRAARAVTSAHGSGQAVADPRTGTKHNDCFRVQGFEDTAGTITAGGHPSAGGQSVADPRMNWNAGAHESKLYVTDWTDPHKAVTGARGPYSGACAVADPRSESGREGAGKYRVTGFGETAGTVIARSDTGQGAYAVADPRPTSLKDRTKGDHYLTGGHYGVVPWDGISSAVPANAKNNNGPWSVADPRDQASHGGDLIMPAPADKLIARIRALDGTWHRPFTTLELAALQSLVDPEDTWVPWQLDGESDQAWRERIGNAIPPDAAEAIADVMGETLLLAWSGETFLLSSRPVWVRPIAIALSVQPGC